jgi:endonuclease/exonuclease/phosphatase family metal-dependent hydrolase
MQAEHLSHASAGEPTYWPSDRRRVPDLLDFRLVKRIPLRTLHAESSLDLSSDHFPVLITIHSKVLSQLCPPTLSTKHTNWEVLEQL